MATLYLFGFDYSCTEPSFETDIRNYIEDPFKIYSWIESQRLSPEEQIKHKTLIQFRNDSKIKIKGEMRSKTQNRYKRLRQSKVFSKVGLRLTNNLKYKN